MDERAAIAAIRRGLGLPREVNADFGAFSVTHPSRVFASVDHARYGAPPGEPLAVWAHRAIGAALSDMACCGADAVYAQIDLQIPRTADATAVEEIGHGVRTAITVYDCTLLNGNNLTVRHDGAFKLTTAVHGISAAERVSPPGRVGARSGHLVGCTRLPGRFNAALRQLNSSRNNAGVDASALLGGLAELAVGRALVASGAASALLDLNDALLLGAMDLAHASGVEFQLSMDTAIHTVTEDVTIDDILAPPSGDLALLFTAAPDRWHDACAAITAAGGSPVRIGLCASGAPRVTLQGCSDDDLHELAAIVWRSTPEFAYPSTAVLTSLSNLTG